MRPGRRRLSDGRQQAAALKPGRRDDEYDAEEEEEGPPNLRLACMPKEAPPPFPPAPAPLPTPMASVSAVARMPPRSSSYSMRCSSRTWAPVMPRPYSFPSWKPLSTSTFSTLPSSSVPSTVLTASTTLSRVSKTTKAKPAGCLVMRLRPTTTRSMGPHREKRECSWKSVVTKARFPTYTQRLL